MECEVKQIPKSFDIGLLKRYWQVRCMTLKKDEYIL